MSSEDYYKRPSGVVCKKDHVGVSSKVGTCVQKEWVVEGGGLCGYFREQDFTDDALTTTASGLFQKWESMNTNKSDLAMVDIASLLVGFTGVAAWPCAGLIGEHGLHGEFQMTMGDLEHGC